MKRFFMFTSVMCAGLLTGCEPPKKADVPKVEKPAEAPAETPAKDDAMTPAEKPADSTEKPAEDMPEETK